MENNIIKTTDYSGIPAQYRVLIKPAQVCGEKLGELIANGWDKLVDILFQDSDKTA